MSSSNNFMGKSNQKIRNASAVTRGEEAFQIYLGLGKDRSLNALTVELGKKWDKKPSFRTVASWSTRYGWVARINQIEAKAAEEADKRAIKSKADIRVRQQQMVDIAFSSLLKKLNEARLSGTLPEFTYSDYEKMMRHELILHGIVKEGPQAINPMNIMQVNLTPEDHAFTNVLRKLPALERHKLTNLIYDAEEEMKQEQIAHDRKVRANLIEQHTT